MSSYYNVFYYYGRDDYSADGEAQLENNTTKALINTLQHSLPPLPQVAPIFFSEILDQKIPLSKFEYILQAAPPSSGLDKIIQKADKLYILVLTPNGKSVSTSSTQNAEKFISQAKKYPIDQEQLSKFVKEIKTRCIANESDHFNKFIEKFIKKRFPKIKIDNLTTDDVFDLYDFYIKKSRPDAWVFWNKTVVLIENKTRTEANQSQLKRHKQLLKKYNKKIEPEVKIKSWRKDVSKALSKIADMEQTNILVKQLSEYLEDINMGPLKFTFDDFLAFDEIDAGQIDQLRKAKDRLYNIGQKVVESALQNHEIIKQKISATYIGINFVNKDFSNKKAYQVPHYSIGLRSELVLSVYITLESKTIISKLLKRYKKQKDLFIDKLSTALSGLKGKDYHIEILDKWHVTSGGTKQNRSTWFPLFEMPLDMLIKNNNWSDIVLQEIESLSTLERRKQTIDKITFLKNFPGKAVYATLLVGKNYKWHDVHEKGPKIVDDILRDVELLKPYYNFVINLL